MRAADPLRMLLLRHGESRWNAMRRWQGRADSPLTARGRDQARAAGEALAEHPLIAGRLAAAELSTIWASTLSRAHQTAALIAAQLGIDRVRCDHRLVEADAGPWQGLTPTEIEAGWPGYLASMQRPGGFESADDLLDRVGNGLRDIAGLTSVAGDPLALVVVHSGVIRRLVEATGMTVDGVPNLTGWLVDVGPATITPVEPFDPRAIDSDRRLAAPTRW